jgi:serine/threonine protein kinase
MVGMVLYEMLTGLPPWYTNDRQKLFDRLRSAPLHFPPYVSKRAESLIRALLNRNPAERLGAASGASQIKQHPFFEHMDWQKLLERRIPPPFRPCRAALSSSSSQSNADHDHFHEDIHEKEMMPLNFEAEFTRLPLPSIEIIDNETQDHQHHASSCSIGAKLSSVVHGLTRRRSSSADSTFAGFTYECQEIPTHHDSYSHRNDDPVEEHDSL